MNYPKYLSIRNWLFKHLESDRFDSSPVGGARPENLYHVVFSFRSLDLSKDLRTYENLIAYGCTEPSDEEILRLLKH